MIIAIDHGNSEIKTVNEVFPSGFTRNPAIPQMAADWINYDGDSFALTGTHMPYRRDKTQNDDYYILTLFAIAKELARKGITSGDIQLAVGLPPAHMQELKSAFRDYLMKDKHQVTYSHNGVEYCIRITNVFIFPQAYPAVYDRYEEISALGRAYIVDIGGYTTDVLMLRRGKLDLECCYSLESGVIKLFSRAAAVLASEFGGTIEETDIADVISGKETLLDDDMRSAILKVATSHAQNLLDSLQTNDIDLRHTPSYFVGGGGLLLKSMLEQSGELKKAVFISDTLANAKGYEAMANELMKNGSVQ